MPFQVPNQEFSENQLLIGKYIITNVIVCTYRGGKSAQKSADSSSVWFQLAKKYLFPCVIENLSQLE